MLVVPCIAISESNLLGARHRVSGTSPWIHQWKVRGKLRPALAELVSILAVPASQENRGRECREKGEGDGGIGAGTVEV